MIDISYSRWWEARELWGVIIAGSRSLVTQLVATTNGNLQAGGQGAVVPQWRHHLHRQVAGWCIAILHTYMLHTTYYIHLTYYIHRQVAGWCIHVT